MEVFRNMGTGQCLCEVGGNVRIFGRDEGLPPFVLPMVEDTIGFIDQSSCVPVGEIGDGWDLRDGKLIDANAAYHKYGTVGLDEILGRWELEKAGKTEDGDA